MMMHSSAANVVVLQGYVNKAYIYVVVTNGSTGLTVDVSEVSLVDIDTTIPTAPSNENVPGTKAIKDYVDKYTPCVLDVGMLPKAGVATEYTIDSGKLSPDRVIIIRGTATGFRVVSLNVFGFRGDNGSGILHGYVLASNGTMVKITFADGKLTPDADID